jgi:hypothetical protein
VEVIASSRGNEREQGAGMRFGEGLGALARALLEERAGSGGDFGRRMRAAAGFGGDQEGREWRPGNW